MNSIICFGLLPSALQMSFSAEKTGKLQILSHDAAYQWSLTSNIHQHLSLRRDHKGQHLLEIDTFFTGSRTEMGWIQNVLRLNTVKKSFISLLKIHSLFIKFLMCALDFADLPKCPFAVLLVVMIWTSRAHAQWGPTVTRHALTGIDRALHLYGLSLPMPWHGISLTFQYSSSVRCPSQSVYSVNVKSHTVLSTT